MNYRISTYEYGFVIEKNHVTGSKAKNPGESYWIPHKYPSNLEQACKLLLELTSRDQADREGINDVVALQKVVSKAVYEVKQIAQQYAESTRTEDE